MSQIFKSINFDSNAGFGKEPKPVIFRSIEYTIETIYEKISNINNLNEDEMKDIIYRQYPMILNYDLFLSSNEKRQLAQKLFTNKKFLNLFNAMIGLLQLDDNQIVCMNKITYDYYVSPNNDMEIANLLLDITHQVNFIMVQKLSTKLGYNGARILAMIARSSFKEEKNIHRINTFLCRCGFNLTVQDIIDIYCILFTRFTNLFIYTMMEDVTCITNQHEMAVYNNISIAMISMLDEYTSSEIMQILTNYGVALMYSNIKAPRFSFKETNGFSIPSRIIYIVNQINSGDNFFSDNEKNLIP